MDSRWEVHQRGMQYLIRFTLWLGSDEEHYVWINSIEISSITELTIAKNDKKYPVSNIYMKNGNQWLVHGRAIERFQEINEGKS